MYPGYKSGYNSVMNNSKLGYSHGLSPFPTKAEKENKNSRTKCTSEKRSAYLGVIRMKYLDKDNVSVKRDDVLSGESLTLNICRL